MYGKERFKVALDFLVILILGWALFSLIDLPYEKNMCDDLTSYFWFIIPVIYTVFYGLKRKYLLTFTSRPVGSFFALLGVWALLCIALGLPIGILAGSNRWIIPQNTHSWILDLNGIEYIILGFFELTLTPILCALLEFVLWIIRIIKKTN